MSLDIALYSSLVYVSEHHSAVVSVLHEVRRQVSYVDLVHHIVYEHDTLLWCSSAAVRKLSGRMRCLETTQAANTSFSCS